MRSFNIQHAKTHLSRLLEDAARGEEIIIAKAGRPYVRLVPYVGDDTPRKLGGMQGQLWVSPDFDRTPDEIVDLFEGRGTAPKAKTKAKTKTKARGKPKAARNSGPAKSTRR